jgi:hypothetical protein
MVDPSCILMLVRCVVFNHILKLELTVVAFRPIAIVVHFPSIEKEVNSSSAIAIRASTENNASMFTIMSQYENNWCCVLLESDVIPFVAKRKQQQQPPPK